LPDFLSPKPKQSLNIAINISCSPAYYFEYFISDTYRKSIKFPLHFGYLRQPLFDVLVSRFFVLVIQIFGAGILQNNLHQPVHFSKHITHFVICFRVFIFSNILDH